MAATTREHTPTSPAPSSAWLLRHRRLATGGRSPRAAAVEVHPDSASAALHHKSPATLSVLTSLVSLHLSDNALTGGGPGDALMALRMGDMASLTFLDLSANNISGGLPSSFAIYDEEDERALFVKKQALWYDSD
ncbi:hypothetical protein HU200_023777 [Digitaria exilis]|uniref:Uncharacterized protein n=1 Tax=Digitaria exilis TaxID=1010633 RepID=A0A835C2I7_9POAL|nr:hypothetical protein HU200_023777 [Digitaria exilis]